MAQQEFSLLHKSNTSPKIPNWLLIFFTVKYCLPPTACIFAPPLALLIQEVLAAGTRRGFSHQTSLWGFRCSKRLRASAEQIGLSVRLHSSTTFWFSLVLAYNQPYHIRLLLVPYQQRRSTPVLTVLSAGLVTKHSIIRILLSLAPVSLGPCCFTAANSSRLTLQTL